MPIAYFLRTVPEAMMRKRLLLGLLAMVYSKLGLASVQLAQVPVLAHEWGLQLYGQWLLLSAIPFFLGASDFGFGTAAGNRLIGEVARDDEAEALVTFQSAWLVVLGCCGASLALIVLLGEAVPDRYLAAKGALNADQARLVLLVLCLYGLVAIMASLFYAVLRSAGHFARSTSLVATIQLIEGMAVIVVVILGKSPLVAALILLGVRSLGSLGQILLAKHYSPWLRLGVRRAKRGRIKELFRPALGAMLLPLAQAGYLQGTALAVGAAAGPSAVPIFISLRTLSRVGLQLLMSASQPLMPEYTVAYARGQLDWIRRVTGGVVTLSIIVGGGYGLGLGLFGEALLNLWTHGAVQAPLLMIVFTAISMLAAALWNTITNLLIAVNRHETFSYFFAIAAGLSVVLTYGFVLRWGISYAAAANLLMDMAVALAAWAAIRSTAGQFPIGPATLIAFLPAGWRKSVS